MDHPVLCTSSRRQRVVGVDRSDDPDIWVELNNVNLYAWHVGGPIQLLKNNCMDLHKSHE